MIIVLLLIGIIAVAVAGIWYVYYRSESQEDFKKGIYVMLAIIALMSLLFLVYDSQTNAVAFGHDPEWGYSPYNENWGGTGPEDDFDLDGIKNAWDQDADNDEVFDNYEYLTRFNPYSPDLGIRNVAFMWEDETTLHIEVEASDHLYDQECTIILYKDAVEVERKPFLDGAEFTLTVNQQVIYMLDFKLENLEGKEALYANKANNFISYTFPGPVLIEFGQWYYDIENEIEGVIRNLRLFGVPNPWLNEFEAAIKAFFAAIPLLFWFLIIAFIIILSLIRYRRKKKGKPPLLWFMRKKKPKYPKGTIKIEGY